MPVGDNRCAATSSIATEIVVPDRRARGAIERVIILRVGDVDVGAVDGRRAVIAVRHRLAP